MPQGEYGRVEPHEISEMWDGREAGWVLLCVEDEDGAVDYLFAHEPTRDIRLFEASHYDELVDVALAHGMPVCEAAWD